MSRIKAPTGWVIVKWKDAGGRRWVNTIPKGDLRGIRKRVKESGGKIIKVYR